MIGTDAAALKAEASKQLKFTLHRKDFQVSLQDSNMYV